MSAHFEFGLDTFLPVTVDDSGLPISADQVIRNAVEEAVLAEAVGIDSFNIGEHYRVEFMDSASHVILAAIASRTERIRCGSCSMGTGRGMANWRGSICAGLTFRRRIWEDG